MQLILDIPAQPATNNEKRQAALYLCFKEGSLLLDARDNLKPARILLKPTDKFPWSEFLEKLFAAWQLGDYEDVPPPFKPQKQIPTFVIEDFFKEKLAQQLKILAVLRTQGYFPPLPSEATLSNKGLL